MKLKFLTVLLCFCFLTSAFNSCEGQRRRHVLDLIKAPFNFIGNVTSIINDIFWPPRYAEKSQTGTLSNRILKDSSDNDTLDEYLDNADFRRAFTRIVQLSRDNGRLREPVRTVLTRRISRLIKLILPDLSVLKPLEHAVRRQEESARSVAICQACKLSLAAVVDYVRHSSDPNSLLEFARMSCPLLPIERDTCYGAVREYGEVILYIIKNRPELRADRMCGMFLQFYGCETSDPYIFWDVLSEMGYPQFDRTRKAVDTPRSENLEGEPTLKILQLTDIHMDPFYSPGSRAQCRKEVCCRGPRVYGRDKEFQAGYFGDYRHCDLPFHTFENALAHIAETHPDIDLIYMTGDLVPHTSIAWKSSKDEVKDAIRMCSEAILKYFPDTPVIPIIGNHDTHPMNLFAPASVKNEFSTSWVYETAAKSWSQWMEPKSLDTFLEGGFYSRIMNPQLRIIVLNNNVCFATNFWQAFEDRDPYGQLHWLVEQLQEAETLNQTVHILAHVPPNTEMCWNVWSDNYYKIITRFSRIIKAQFFAHTHHDDFGLYYDPIERDQPISSYFVGASLTPYVDLNPGYKIYTVDGARGVDSTYEILDHETWIFNLTDANLTPDKSPQWYRLYRAKEMYDLESLSPMQLHSFVKRMSSNETAFQEFYLHYYKGAVTKKSQTCDEVCRKARLCSMVSPTFKDYGRCVLMESSDRTEVLPIELFSSLVTNRRGYSGFSSGPILSGVRARLKVIGPMVRTYGF